LMCDAEHRLGRNGVQEIMQHEFFRSVDWNKIKTSNAPYKPELKTQVDCTRFDKFEE
jgi:hypothetical protein